MKENGSNLETQLCWLITVFDKKEFVESVIKKGLRLHEIVSEARAEIHQTESRAIRPVGSRDYALFLRILVFFLISVVKVRPANLSYANSTLLLHLARYLVGRGDLTSDVFELFGE